MESRALPEDLLGLHILQARADFRRVSAADRNKGQKKTDRELTQSFFQARRLGFLGSRDTWDNIMRWGVAEVTSAFGCPEQPMAD